MIAFAAPFMRLVRPFHEAMISLIAPPIQQKMQPALRQLLIITAIPVSVNMNTISRGFPAASPGRTYFLRLVGASQAARVANEQAHEAGPWITFFAGGQTVHERRIASIVKRH